MDSTDDRREIRFWRPDSPSVTGMIRVEREDRLKTTYTEQLVVLVIYEGAFDGWVRGRVRTHVAGAIKLKQPGEVHRGVRIHAPYTIQGAGFSAEAIDAAAAAIGLRGNTHVEARGFGPGERATQLVFAMHDALVRPEVPELERATRVTEALHAVLGSGSRRSTATVVGRAPRAVQRARALLHDALADKITLDELAAHAGLDKFHLVRAFRAELGVPPYEYLTHLRVWRARELLMRGTRVAETAQRVGFCDESQLGRHFRRIVGVAPGRFARSFACAVQSDQHRPSRARRTKRHSPDGRVHPPRPH